jgi:hypothetical protein
MAQTTIERERHTEERSAYAIAIRHKVSWYAVV